MWWSWPCIEWTTAWPLPRPIIQWLTGSTATEPLFTTNAGRSPDHAVVLIDEIDKADPDVPNALLVPLGSNQFVVRETQIPVTVPTPPPSSEPLAAPVLVVITSNGGPAFLYRNDVLNGNRMIRLTLRGTKSNRDAIGAKVRVTAGEGRYSKMVKTGSSYLSQSELPLSFGLGTRAAAERVEIEWPSGGREELKALAAGADCVMIGALLYLTFHLQIVLGFGPLEAGLASLPMTLVIMVCAPLLTKALPIVGPRPMMIVGPLVAGAGLLWLATQITADGSYAVQVLPALLVMGVGLAGVFVPMQNLALSRVAPHDAGAASATSNAMMQIGGSIGLAVFTNLYAGAVASSTSTVGGPLGALVDGYSVAFLAAAIAMLLAAPISFFLIRGRKEDLLPTEAPVHLG